MAELTPDRIFLGLVAYVVLLFSLSFHESAHAWTAWKMGDDTALSQGRISLNPLVHMDPIGTVLMPILQFLFAGAPLLAWAKPTPVSPQHFKNLGRGHVFTSGAGPLSNLILAVVFTAALFVVRLFGVADPRGPVIAVILTGIQLNVALGLFNLVPIPPLDGAWVASWGLPRSIAQHYDRLVEPYGQWLLLILFMPIGWILGPLSAIVMHSLAALVF